MYSRKELDEVNKLKYQKNGIIGILTRKYISTNITRLIARTSIKPDQVTFFALFVGLVGCFLISTGNPLFLVYGGLLIFLAKVFDSVDGELARLKKLESKRGAWIDAISDRFKEYILVFCITLGLFNQTGEIIVWYFGFLAGLGFHMIAIVLEYTGQMDQNVLKSTQEDTFVVKLARKLHIKPQFLALQADTYLFITYVLVIFNQLLYVLLFQMIVMNLYWMMIVLFVYRGAK